MFSIDPCGQTLALPPPFFPSSLFQPQPFSLSLTEVKVTVDYMTVVSRRLQGPDLWLARVLTSNLRTEERRKMLLLMERRAGTSAHLGSGSPMSSHRQQILVIITSPSHKGPCMKIAKLSLKCFNDYCLILRLIVKDLVILNHI